MGKAYLGDSVRKPGARLVGKPPLTKGYGTKFINATIERQLDGAATFEWRRDGLHCTLSVPLGDKLKLAERANGARFQTSLREQAVAVPQMLVGNRLLLVEDEALVAMALKDMLTELGFEVVGAFNKVTEALAVVTNQDVNAAILDVNLGGELIYPVADCLVAKGVPFVFITGYGAGAIDGRFASCRVLQKLIQRQKLQNTFIVGSGGPARRPLDVGMSLLERTEHGTYCLSFPQSTFARIDDVARRGCLSLRRD